MTARVTRVPFYVTPTREQMQKWRIAYQMNTIRPYDLLKFLIEAKRLHETNEAPEYWTHLHVGRDINDKANKVALVVLPMIAAGVAYWLGSRSC